MAKKQREFRGLEGLEAALGSVARPSPDPVEALQRVAPAEPTPIPAAPVQVQPAPEPVAPPAPIVVSPPVPVAVQPLAEPQEIAEPETKPRASGAQQASRRGKVQCQFWTEEEIRAGLKITAITRGTTLDALLNKAARAIIRGDI